jgi:membrane protein insertase Oxa1/YidC/SpoIIIJ
MQNIMKYMPFFFGFISLSMQAALVVYWIAGNIFTTVQQSLIYRKLPPKEGASGGRTISAKSTVSDTGSRTNGEASL